MAHAHDLHQLPLVAERTGPTTGAGPERTDTAGCKEWAIRGQHRVPHQGLTFIEPAGIEARF